MRHTLHTLLLLLPALVVLQATPSHAAPAPETLRGEYTTWDGFGDGKLEVVFTPTGSNQWTVAFHFTFDGQAHVYNGTAQGSLTEGELKGRVFNESRSRTFTFKGSFKDGTFSGTHSELDDGEENEMGLLTLKR